MAEILFANISSHRNSEWQKSQINAAKEIVGPDGRIIDMPFPRIDPSANEAEVEQMAKDMASAIGPTIKAAMVQGEYALTIYLIRELEKFNIACYVAALERGYTKYKGQEQRRFVRFRKVSLNQGGLL